MIIVVNNLLVIHHSLHHGHYHQFLINHDEPLVVIITVLGADTLLRCQGFSIGYTLDAVGPIVVASMLSIFVSTGSTKRCSNLSSTATVSLGFSWTQEHGWNKTCKEIQGWLMNG